MASKISRSAPRRARDQPDRWGNGNSGWATGTQGNKSNTLSGNVSSTRLIQSFSPSLCNTLKNINVKIAVLYTTYLPLTTNAFYQQWVAPIASNIPSNLQACASPGLYFEVSPNQGISEAMQQMFVSALTTARLSQ